MRIKVTASNILKGALCEILSITCHYLGIRKENVNVKSS